MGLADLKVQVLTTETGGSGGLADLESLFYTQALAANGALSNPLKATDGTAAAPSITFSTDTDNGIFLAGTNIVGVATAGSERLRIDAAGNTGIGTAADSAALLHIKDGSFTQFRIEANGANDTAILFHEDTNLKTKMGYDTSTGLFKIVSGGGGFSINHLSIDTSGDVGIGTAPDASARLDVSSTTKGFLPPRMTTAQRDAISTPATGLTIYNTTTNVLNFFNGSVWGAV